jgi:hypothetical protein
MLLKVNIYNTTSLNLETDIGETETILEFMNKHNILSNIPDKHKCIIYENQRISNNNLIKDYIKERNLYFWFKLRWFLDE